MSAANRTYQQAVEDAERLADELVNGMIRDVIRCCDPTLPRRTGEEWEAENNRRNSLLSDGGLAKIGP